VGGKIFIYLKYFFKHLENLLSECEVGRRGAVEGGVEFGTQDIKYSHHEVTGGTELHVEQ
jgi:hypothetical protein